jgi:hypothetical protein
MHGWQDIVLAIGALIFDIALIPSILSEHKPAVWTSSLTAGVLAVFAVTYASLSLWYATVTTVLASILWGVLLLQKLMEKS